MLNEESQRGNYPFIKNRPAYLRDWKNENENENDASIYLKGYHLKLFIFEVRAFIYWACSGELMCFLAVHIRSYLVFHLLTFFSFWAL